MLLRNFVDIYARNSRNKKGGPIRRKLLRRCAVIINLKRRVIPKVHIMPDVKPRHAMPDQGPLKYPAGPPPSTVFVQSTLQQHGAYSSPRPGPCWGRFRRK